MLGGGKGQSWSIGRMVMQGFLFLMAVTGVLVWLQELVDLMWFELHPENLQEIVKREEEDQRKREEFYEVDPKLPDDLYYAELAAKERAMVDLIRRIDESELARTLSTRPITYVFLDQGTEWAAASTGPAPDVGEEPAGGDGWRGARGGARVWDAKFCMEGTKGIALAEVRFEKGGNGEWTPTQCFVESMGRTGQSLVNVRAQLPHGVKYIKF